MGPPSANPCGRPGDRPPDDERHPTSVSHLIQSAEDAFRRDLPQLLNERPGNWVAYRGDQQIGFAPAKQQLYEECLNREFLRGEFLVLSIEPEPGELLFGPGAIGDILSEHG